MKNESSTVLSFLLIAALIVVPTVLMLSDGCEGIHPTGPTGSECFFQCVYSNEQDGSYCDWECEDSGIEAACSECFYTVKDGKSSLTCAECDMNNMYFY